MTERTHCPYCGTNLDPSDTIGPLSPCGHAWRNDNAPTIPFSTPHEH